MHGSRRPTRRGFLRAGLPLVGLGALLPTGWFRSTALAATPQAAILLPTEQEIRGRSPDLWRLTDLINDARVRLGRSRIPFSVRLSAVAALHARDLYLNEPQRRYGSLHSWSHDTRWTGGGYYPADAPSWPIMWHKPREITGYPGLGFEIGAAYIRGPRHAVQEWLASKPHRVLMLGEEIWQGMTWRAVGATFYQGYACAWFGTEADPG